MYPESKTTLSFTLKSCEKYKLAFCIHCGCLMKLKTKINHEECPDKKWGSYTPEVKIIEITE